jgi:hypothetical protein
LAGSLSHSSFFKSSAAFFAAASSAAFLAAASSAAFLSAASFSSAAFLAAAAAAFSASLAIYSGVLIIWTPNSSALATCSISVLRSLILRRSSFV